MWRAGRVHGTTVNVPALLRTPEGLLVWMLSAAMCGARGGNNGALQMSDTGGRERSRWLTSKVFCFFFAGALPNKI